MRLLALESRVATNENSMSLLVSLNWFVFGYDNSRGSYSVYVAYVLRTMIS